MKNYVYSRQHTTSTNNIKLIINGKLSPKNVYLKLSLICQMVVSDSMLGNGSEHLQLLPHVFVLTLLKNRSIKCS